MKKRIIKIGTALVLAISSAFLVSCNKDREEGNGWVDVYNTEEDKLVGFWRYSECITEYGGRAKETEFYTYKFSKCGWEKEIDFSNTDTPICTMTAIWEDKDSQTGCNRNEEKYKYKLENKKLILDNGVEKIEYEIVSMDRRKIVFKYRDDFNEDNIEDVATFTILSKHLN
ncbi:hypothetical protein JSO54_08725 [Riemerella anatipestifer]|uniref:hypothetical protein n=1 Tax=Riemerella anatipestifer TaxID=34085 RepID=UPI001374E03F|nr:hypothetical protein [Riemerella anatipestifer]MDY3339407.1 hypothetical protein [Riemerella anatipestifer]